MRHPEKVSSTTPKPNIARTPTSNEAGKHPKAERKITASHRDSNRFDPSLSGIMRTLLRNQGRL